MISTKLYILTYSSSDKIEVLVAHTTAVFCVYNMYVHERSVAYYWHNIMMLVLRDMSYCYKQTEYLYSHSS